MLHPPPLPVALRYLLMRLLKGKREVVAPISAPMLQIVAIPVEGSLWTHDMDNYYRDQSKVLIPLRPLILTGAGNGFRPRSVVLYDGPCSSCHCQDIGHLQNHVLRSCPTTHLTNQPHTYHLWGTGKGGGVILSLQLP